VVFDLKVAPKMRLGRVSQQGSIGYPVGALLGALKAAPDRRHLLFVGDARSRSQRRSG